MKTYICNLLEKPGCIRTGYEQRLEGTREEVIRDYLHWLAEDGLNMEEDDIDIVEVDWEE